MNPNIMSIQTSPSRALSETIGLIYRSGMTTTSGGNLSVKDEHGGVWITPAGVDKGQLTEQDIVCWLPSGKVVGKHRPSSELPIHRQIYERRPDLGAVIHAHPEALVAYAIAGKEPNLAAIPQARVTCGEVVFTPYELPGSEMLGKVIADSFAANPEVHAVIMGNHGVVVAGTDLDDAFQRFETLELCARALIHAQELGEVKVLCEDKLKEFEAAAPSQIPPQADWQSSEQDQELRHQLCEMVRRACRQNLMISSYGTLSHRVGAEGEDHFVMTPHGVSRLKLQEADMVTVLNGQIVSAGCPSRATNLHRAIYRKYPEIQSIMMTQAPTVTAHAVAHQTVDVHTNPESWVFARDISMVPFGVQLGEAPQVPASLTPDNPVAIVENDCVIAMGGSLTQTFDRIEVAEFTARSNIMAGRIGGACRISPERIEELRSAFMS